MAQADSLEPYQSVLNQSVTSTVFAQAYNISGIEIENWALSPGQIPAIYDKIILPPLRRIDRIELLKAAWQKRMSQEGELAEKWSNEKASGGLNARSPAYEKFITESLPDLRWNAEVDFSKLVINVVRLAECSSISRPTSATSRRPNGWNNLVN